MNLKLSSSVMAFMAISSGFLFAQAAPRGGTDLPPINIPLAEYNLLKTKCKGGGSNAASKTSSYVGVKYEDGSLTTFNFDQCYPYELNGSPAVQAVFCRSATCVNNPNPNCTGGAVPPVPVVVPAGLTLANVLDWVQLLGQGATCEKNELSGVVI